MTTLDSACVRSSDRPCWPGRLQRKRAVQALEVVVSRVGTKHVFEMAAAEDQRPVEGLGADGADERSAWAFAPGARIGVSITVTPSPRAIWYSRARETRNRRRYAERHSPNPHFGTPQPRITAGATTSHSARSTSCRPAALTRCR